MSHSFCLQDNLEHGLYILTTEYSASLQSHHHRHHHHHNHYHHCHNSCIVMIKFCVVKNGLALFNALWELQTCLIWFLHWHRWATYRTYALNIQSWGLHILSATFYDSGQIASASCHIFAFCMKMPHCPDLSNNTHCKTALLSVAFCIFKQI